MTRFPIFACFFGLSLVLTLVGCGNTAKLDGDGLAADVAVGESIIVHLYEYSDGFESQAFGCTDEEDGITVDDPSIVLVTPLGYEKVDAVNGYDPDALKFSLTGLKLGRVALTSTCNGAVSSQYLFVR